MTNTSSMLATQIINILTTFWVVQLLAKQVAPDEFALYAVIAGIIQFAPILTDTFTSGIARYVTASHAKSDTKTISKIVTTTILINTVAAFAISLVCLLIAWHLDALIQIPENRLVDARLIFGLLIAGSLVYLPLAPLTTGLIAEEMFIKISLINLFSSAIKSLILFELFYLYDASIIFLAFATFISEITVHILKAFYSYKALPSLRFSLKNLDFMTGKDVVWFGTWGAVGQTANSIRNGSDPIILNHFSSNAEVGTLHIASLFDKQIRNLIGIITTPLEPMMTKLYAQGTDESLKRLFIEYNKILIIITLPPVLATLLYADDIIRLYLGSAITKYTEATTVFTVLLAGIPIFITLNPISVLCRAQAKINSYVKIILFSQAVNLALTLLLVAGFGLGALGASLATLATTLIYPFLVWPFACKLVGASIQEYLSTTMRSCVPAAVVFLVGLFLRDAFTIDTWSITICFIMIFSLVSYLLSFALSTKNEKEYVRSLFRFN